MYAGLGILTLFVPRWFCVLASSLAGDILPKLIGLLFLVTGVTLAVASLVLLWRGLSSSTWPQARGHIISSSVKTWRTSRGTWYEPQVRYEYRVDGVRYEGKRLSYSQMRFVREEPACKIVSEYPAGSELMVYYSPKKPQRSVLVPRLTNKGVFVAAAILGIMIGAVGPALMVLPVESSHHAKGQNRAVPHTPYDLLVLVFPMAVVALTIYWVRRPGHHLNPAIPAFVVSLTVPIWLLLAQLGTEHPFKPTLL